MNGGNAKLKAFGERTVEPSSVCIYICMNEKRFGTVGQTKKTRQVKIISRAYGIASVCRGNHGSIEKNEKESACCITFPLIDKVSCCLLAMSLTRLGDYIHAQQHVKGRTQWQSGFR